MVATGVETETGIGLDSIFAPDPQFPPAGPKGESGEAEAGAEEAAGRVEVAAERIDVTAVRALPRPLSNSSMGSSRCA